MPYRDRAPIAFFQRAHAGFARILGTGPRSPRQVDALLDEACENFEQRVATQRDSEAALACRKGCATCCSLRVTATAPEVLRIARHLRAAVPVETCLHIVARIAAADARTRGLGEADRVHLRQRCAFISRGACAIYAVRPLACRGHASFNRQACARAAAGRSDTVPASEAHRVARSLVQNAMQSALRDAGCAWAVYELNHALRIALGDPDSEAAWLAGKDVFADAQVDDVSLVEMARGFEHIKSIRLS